MSDQTRTPLYRDVSGVPLNRRVVAKAAAGLAAMVAAGDSLLTPATAPSASAQEAEGTRARSWDEAESIDTSIKLEGDGWVTLRTEFPFWAVGFGWDAEVGTWPVVEFEVAYDESGWWSGVERMDARSDGGPAPADNRHHTDLFFADGQQYIRYRTVDGEGNLVILDRFIVTYIDPTDGPWEPDRGMTLMRTSSANTDTNVPPAIITRAQWGANEKYRFDNLGEIWPPEYSTVKHAIVHHAAVNYGSDGYNAVRSIYYYHAVTQGWGDIGYNYLVDVRGNIFEGRVGGANVIGGHAYQYAVGSSGICVMGNFSVQEAPQASKAALANILAYVVRDLNPYGRALFHEVPNLPTIAAHRDVIQSTCPGDGLYKDMPWLRDTVAATLDKGLLDSQMPGGIVPGDWVKVQTEDKSSLSLRAQPGVKQLIIDSIPNGTRMEVERGPVTDSDYNWYLVLYKGKQGWVPADFLVVDPPTEDPMSGYSYGQNIKLGSKVAIKKSPSTNAQTLETQTGSWAFLVAGPYPAGGTKWFQVQTENRVEGWITISQFTIDKVTNPTPKYSIGQKVQTTRSSVIRIRAGLPQTVQANVAAGRTLTISVAPVSTTGRTWYGVFGGTGTGGGWIDAADIGLPPQPISAIGDLYRVTSTMNFRSAPGTGASIIGTLNEGSTGQVIGGPRDANGYKWWQLRTSGGTVGWAATNWLVKTGHQDVPKDPDPAPSPSPTPTPTGKFAIGDTMRVTESLNLRSGAGTNNGVVAVLPTGTTGKVLEGPRTASGYTWWRVQTSLGTGWSVENWMAKQSSGSPAPAPTDPAPAPPPTGKFAKGDTARVTEALNLRSGAGTNFDAIATMPAGTTGEILDGPRSGSGYTWWQIRTRYGTGWAVENWMTRQSSGSTAPAPSTGFKIGGTATVTEGLNLRTGAGTGNSVITVLPAGTRVTLLDGPRSASGYTWWQVRTNYGTGWVVQDWLRT